MSTQTTWPWSVEASTLCGEKWSQATLSTSHPAPATHCLY